MTAEGKNLYWKTVFYLGLSGLLAFLAGVLLSFVFLTAVARELNASYAATAATWVKACQHEMTTRGELGLLQQEMEINGASLQRQGITFVEVVSLSGLVILHSDENMLGETVPLTLSQSGALKGENYQKIAGSGDQTRIMITAPLANYDQIWGALTISLKPRKEHIWPLRIGLVKRSHIFLTLCADLLLFLFCIFKILRNSKSARENLLKRENDLRKQELAAVSAGLAHEVKNSLNGITLNSQLLYESLKESGARESQLRKLERIEKEAAASGEMLAAFLNYAGQSNFTLKEMNLTALVNELGQFFQEAGGKDGVEVVFSAGENLRSVRACESSLRHALTNLMWNALEAVKGAPGAKVELSALQKGGEILLSVRDNGPGIPQDKREKIFEAFYTTKKSGVGLGLAVAKKAALEHGGRLELADTPEGCLFVLRFPLKQKDENE
ncbi:HAMP domain-containing histidine kinase [bacterium]|nr:HAMP domain-containing histidine kinase [bacterium]